MTNEMTTTYTLIRHNPSGETYAVLARDELPMGLCGPLHHSIHNARPADLVNLEYDTEDIESGWYDEQEWVAVSHSYSA